jgi:hypothetical protein
MGISGKRNPSVYVCYIVCISLLVSSVLSVTVAKHCKTSLQELSLFETGLLPGYCAYNYFAVPSVPCWSVEISSFGLRSSVDNFVSRKSAECVAAKRLLKVLGHGYCFCPGSDFCVPIQLSQGNT